MKIIPYEVNGVEVPGLYIVVEPGPLGNVRVYGPGTLAQCEAYVEEHEPELPKPKKDDYPSPGG